VHSIKSQHGKLQAAYAGIITLEINSNNSKAKNIKYNTMPMCS